MDKEKVLFLVVNEFGPWEDDRAADGMLTLLTAMEADTHVTDLRWAAYMLATAYHETGKTWRPIEEYGRGKGHSYGVPDPQTGKAYYGRGYVQLTWRDNYAEMGRIFGLDFVHEPELVMRPDVAYQIMSYGMRKGSFTGVSLGRFIDGGKCDYRNARRIINGVDCAERIAGYAERFEKIIKEVWA